MTSNHLYSERERNILEDIHVYDNLKKCVRREPVVSIFHFFSGKQIQFIFSGKKIPYTEILWTEKVPDAQMVSFPASGI